MNGKVEKERTGVVRSLLIGIAQVVAIHPSISRSGSTIFTGVATGLKREDVAHFSFLMSIPAILGGVVVELWKIQKTGFSQVLESTGIFSILIAVAVAAVTGYLALRIVIDTIKHGKLWVFGVYTSILGLMILFDAYVTHIINWSLMSFS
jgi:undecaprenyl-diphosphatase